MYYLNSRFYDSEISRFISADTVDVSRATADSLTNKNLYAYCDNNPVIRIDTTGNCWVTVGIIATGGVVGTLLGAFSAAATGGDVLEGAIKGGLTGVLGSTCGLLPIHPLGAVALATFGGSVIDLGMQLAVQYNESDSLNLSNLDKTSILKIGRNVRGKTSTKKKNRTNNGNNDNSRLFPTKI